MSRKTLAALFIIAALSIAVGGMACGDPQEELDQTGETLGAT